MPDANEKITVYRLTSVRTSVVRSDPRRVVLAIGAGEEVWHFELGLDDLESLGRRIAQDAMILKA